MLTHVHRIFVLQLNMVTYSCGQVFTYTHHEYDCHINFGIFITLLDQTPMIILK